MCLLRIACLCFIVIASTVAEDDDRNSKHFSLFSVVTFKNEECTSDTALAGGARAGTCYTATECSDKSGTTSGNCASGFGVCCVFINVAANGAGTIAAAISENRTWLRNSEYPTVASATTAQAITYTVSKMQSDICQMRLDFQTFLIGGPANTAENIAGQTSLTHCTRDSLIVTTTDTLSVENSPTGTICGLLTGEHLYYDLSPTAADQLTLTLATAATATLTPTVAQRSWDIKVSQIPCYANYRAPAGCQRYLMTNSGTILSLNFAKSSGTTQAANAQNSGIELASQRVNTCIRRSKGMCCVEYQLCVAYEGIQLADAQNEDATNVGAEDNWTNEAWTIDTDLSPFEDAAAPDFDTDQGLTDAACTGDYVEIPSSWSATCGSGFGSARNTISSRYCGNRFGFQVSSASNLLKSTAVCDCSEPFQVRHVTDLANDLGGAAAVEVAGTRTAGNFPRGFCLDFRQTPCWQ